MQKRFCDNCGKEATEGPWHLEIDARWCTDFSVGRRKGVLDFCSLDCWNQFIPTAFLDRIPTAAWD